MNERKYYIAVPGGDPEGPFSESELKLMTFQRKIGKKHLYCVEGMPEWRPVAELDIFPKVAPSTATGQSAERVNTHLVPAIIVLTLSCLFCLFTLPVAIVAIIQAARAESKRVSDPAGARKAAESAWTWLLFCYALMAIQVIGLIIMMAA